MKYSIILFILLAANNITGQNTPVDSLITLLNTEQVPYERAKINLHLARLHERIDFEKGKNYARKAMYSESDSLMAEATNQLGRFYFYTAQLDSAEYYFEQAKEHLKKLKDDKKTAIINISIGAIQLRKGDYTNTIKTLTESVKYFEETGDELNSAKCYSNMSASFAELGNYKNAIEYNEKALEIFNNKNLNQFRLITLPNLAAQHLKNGDTIKAINYSLEAEKLALSLNNKRSLSIIYNNLGSAYLDIDETKAKNYLEKTISLKNELNLRNGIEVAQGNLGYLHLKNKEYKKALSYYQLVEQQVNGKQLVFAYDQIQKCYEGLNQYNRALEYSEKSRVLNDSLLNAENQSVFNDILTRYETEKKEKEILALQTRNLKVNNRRIRNQILLFIVLGIFLITVLIFYFVLKIAKRKRLLIQQEMKIKTQELVDKLKTQELNGIDAILDAQENERTRIANDLHDNLGSRIATLKLYINELGPFRKSEKQELLEKLKSLAEETYHEVRQIAHNKNTGALISKGLIPSMTVIANQLSSTEKLNVEVININVKERIKNNIEIQVFRIVQELLTNIVKHSGATEATIQFSEDNNMLSIMVEDNGSGFDTNHKNYGYGLSNIERRIEKMNGNMAIDSGENNGTTVILNIPL